MKVDYSILEDISIIPDGVGEVEESEFPGAFKGMVIAVIFAMPWWLIFYGFIKLIV